jgi:succinate-semialdehyde dehydrogenase/glutarate-semialdehyde dehydrogenase
VTNPSTGKPIGKVARADIANLACTLAAAQRGFDTWKNIPANQRANTMRKAAGLLRQRAADLGQLMTQQQGKPFWGRAVKCLQEQTSLSGVPSTAGACMVRIVPSRHPAAQQLGDVLTFV